MVIKNLNDFGFKTANRTYIIAEIGINHRGCVKTAKRLIDSAVRAGVDAVKFQTYLTEQRAPEGNDVVFKLLKELELPFEAFTELKEYCDQLGITFFSTPFDAESVAYLESIDTALYKIASFDVVNKPLLQSLAQTKKPIIMSVGMSDLNEIKAAYDILNQGDASIALMHCISAYPTQEDQALLSNIYQLQHEFDCVIGQSDHTNDIQVPLYAVAAGAQIIEKHFKIDDDFECIDAPVSITEKQMSELVIQIRRVESIFGNTQFGLREPEQGATIFRRHRS